MPDDGTKSGTQKVLNKSGKAREEGAALQHDSTISLLSIEAEEPSLRSGKDEMNLAEYPFAKLRQKGSQDRPVIEINHEHRHHKTGKLVQARWRVEGSAELGLPGPAEERLYLVLMELTREQGMTQEVWFSRGDLLRRLGMQHNDHSYRQLRESFMRLNAVRITADNAFWNPTTQNYYTSIYFGLVDEIRIEDEPGGRRGQGQLPLSSFKWHNVVHTSMQSGYIRSLDTGFALALELPLAMRLFRYLDKHRRGKDGAGRASFEIGLQRLCEVHLGMAPSKYPSKHKERLEPAHDELIRRGFLNAVQYEPMKTQDGLKAVYSFAAAPVVTEAAPVPQLRSPVAPVPVQIAPVPAAETRLERLRRTTGIEDIELRGLCKAVFDGLPSDLQEKLRAQARQGVPSFGWERLEEPESPLSLALWEMVAADCPNELDLAIHEATKRVGGVKSKRRKQS